MTDYREISSVLGNLGDLVNAARRQRGVTLRDIERRTGVTNSNVLRITRGENCTVKHARALLAWLDDPEITKDEVRILLGEDVPEKLPRIAPFTRPDSNVFVVPEEAEDAEDLGVRDLRQPGRVLHLRPEQPVDLSEADDAEPDDDDAPEDPGTPEEE